MLVPREIIVDWQTDAGSGFRSVLYFQEGTAAADAREQVYNFLVDMSGGLTNSVLWEVEHDSRLLDNATGTLIGMDTDSPNYNGSGADAGQQVADASQVLVRWATGQVINGRFLKGRTFFPGAPITLLNNGNLSPTALGSFGGWVNDFLAAAPTFGVWHRPVSGSGGAFWPVTSGTVWSELAVLRRRRN